eukprot:COSAG03_NODE_5792_length_1172_cov_1.777260_2_plen_85_part_01
MAKLRIISSEAGVCACVRGARACVCVCVSALCVGCVVEVTRHAAKVPGVLFTHHAVPCHAVRVTAGGGARDLHSLLMMSSLLMMR